MTSTGYIYTCYRCERSWGNCKCEADSCGSFIFNNYTITDPTKDESGFLFVDPYEYYGTRFITWLSLQSLNIQAMYSRKK